MLKMTIYQPQTLTQLWLKKQSQRQTSVSLNQHVGTYSSTTHAFIRSQNIHLNDNESIHQSLIHNSGRSVLITDVSGSNEVTPSATLIVCCPSDSSNLSIFVHYLILSSECSKHLDEPYSTHPTE